MPAPTASTAATRPSAMLFTQYYIDCLSQASYLIGDTGTGLAVIVDPRRDIQEYLDDAAAAGLRIIGMINTHFHADFLSGHLELAQATGAWIGYGAAAHAEFETRALAGGERIILGDVVLQILHTPGHTPESVSVLVCEHAGDEVAYGVLTGDALFIGDVGRPDLLASIGVTAGELGSQLCDSIQHKLMALPDAVRVFPGHGAGSACGKNLSADLVSTNRPAARLQLCLPADERGAVHRAHHHRTAACPGVLRVGRDPQPQEARHLRCHRPGGCPGRHRSGRGAPPWGRRAGCQE